MNTSLTLPLLLVLVGVAGDEPATLSKSPPERAPVEVRQIADGSFEYVIRDIRTPRWSGRRLGFGRAIEFFRQVLENPTFTVNPVTGEASFSREKRYGDIEERIQRCAKGNGFMPYWEELVARASYADGWQTDLVKPVFSGDLQGTAPQFVGFGLLPGGEGKARRYQLRVRGAGAGRGSQKRSQIHEYTIDKIGESYRLKHSYSRPDFGQTAVQQGLQELQRVSLGKDETAEFRVNRLTPHCDGGEMYCLRLVAGDGRQLWRSDTEVFGRYRLMAADFDADDRDELIIFREGHLKGTVLIFEVSPEVKSKG